MKVKNYMADFDLNPISDNPLHGPITPELIEYIHQRNEEKLQASIERLGTKWLLHPANKINLKDAR